MRPPILAFFAPLLAALLASPAARAETAWEALKRPGVVAIMRHAIAPGTGDPANYRLGDCSTQRNLDERGRNQARQIGQAFRENGIEFDRILSSQWCRCLETAQSLGLGTVEEFPALNSFYAKRSARGAQTRETLEFLANLPDDARVMLVTHQVNITALTGRAVSSGEVFVIKIKSDGKFDVLGEILIRP